MYKNIDTFVKDFVPAHLKANPYASSKTKVLVYIYLFNCFTSVCLLISDVFFFPENQAQIIISTPLLFIALYFFRRFGNIIFASNVLAFVWVLTLVPTLGYSGGIYSDDLLWLIVAPMIAFLFAGRISGYCWSLFLFTVTTVFYIAEENATVSFREQVMGFDGSYYYFSYLSLFIVVLMIIIVFVKGKEDVISMLKAQKQELLEQKHEIAVQTEELKKTEAKLLETNKELEHFAYIASHDLKEPLRMIKAYTQLIKLRASKILDDETKEYMGFVDDGTERMQRLLEDLLEYSRTGRSNKKQQPNDLNEILLIVVKNLMVQMNTTKANVQVGKMPVVYSSGTEMIQLFQNIISNAIKFTEENKIPEVKIFCHEEREHYVISIEDNGKGIAKDYQEKVFAVFERAGASRQVEGTGLGLATCKKIVKNMGGSIWLNSECGRGTTFFFTLPKTPPINLN